MQYVRRSYDALRKQKIWQVGKQDKQSLRYALALLKFLFLLKTCSEIQLICCLHKESVSAERNYGEKEVVLGKCEYADCTPPRRGKDKCSFQQSKQREKKVNIPVRIW